MGRETPLSPAARAAWLAIGALAALAGGPGCGANTADPLIGTWKMSETHCNGNLRKFGASASLTITYAVSGDYSAKMTGPACPSLTETGRFSRSGLSVTETATSRDCGSGCAFPALGIACTGVDDTVRTNTFVVSVGEVDSLEKSGVDRTFCVDQGDIPVTEVELFGRQ